MLRRSVGLLGISLAALGLNGCSDGVGQGMPANVDMTKDYAPKVEMPGMSPKIQKKAMSKKATPAPAPAAEASGTPDK